jgi:hypothetical protein
MSEQHPLRHRHAACSCGRLSLEVVGEPVRVSICHCEACQRRTGSVFGAQARFALEAVAVKGHSTAFARTADSGEVLTFHFCPVCGSTVHYTNSGLPGFVGIPVGAFADPQFAQPTFSVYERSMHAWVAPPKGAQRASD